VGSHVVRLMFLDGRVMASFSRLYQYTCIWIQVSTATQAYVEQTLTWHRTCRVLLVLSYAK